MIFDEELGIKDHGHTVLAICHFTEEELKFLNTIVETIERQRKDLGYKSDGQTVIVGKLNSYLRRFDKYRKKGK